MCLFSHSVPVYLLSPSPNASCMWTGILLVVFMAVSLESRTGPDTRHRKHVCWILPKKKSSHLTGLKQLSPLLINKLLEGVDHIRRCRLHLLYLLYLSYLLSSFLPSVTLGNPVFVTMIAQVCFLKNSQ